MVRKRTWNVLLGFGVITLCNFVMVSVVAPSLDTIPGVYFAFDFILFIGLIQLIYVIPLIIAAKIKRWEGFTLGAIIAAGITLFLNAIGIGFLFWIGSKLADVV